MMACWVGVLLLLAVLRTSIDGVQMASDGGLLGESASFSRRIAYQY